AFDDLRDTQVQLGYVTCKVQAYPDARSFHDYLLDSLEREAARARRRVRAIRTDRLGETIANCRAGLRLRLERLSPAQARGILLRAVGRAFTRALRCLRRIRSDDPSTIHRTRVAFKTFRYMVESLAEVFPGITLRRLAAMRHYQAAMGD